MTGRLVLIGEHPNGTRIEITERPDGWHEWRLHPPEGWGSYAVTAGVTHYSICRTLDTAKRQARNEAWYYTEHAEPSGRFKWIKPEEGQA